jgi:hypothetical protein
MSKRKRQVENVEQVVEEKKVESAEEEQVTKMLKLQTEHDFLYQILERFIVYNK